jgi:hypothetical protein
MKNLDLGHGGSISDRSAEVLCDLFGNREDLVADPHDARLCAAVRHGA